jgi:hypothetical protein
MVLSGNDIDLSFAQIATALNAKPFGTPSYAVQRLHVLGLQVDYRPRTLADAMTDIQQHRPLICFVRTQFLDHWTKDVAHAVVLVDIEPEQRFWTHDPWLADGPTPVSWDGFLAAWTEFDFRSVTLTPIVQPKRR